MSILAPDTRAASVVWVVGLAATVACVVGFADVAHAARTLRTEGSALVIATDGAEPLRLELGCGAVSVLESGNAAYVACGRDGYVVVSLAPTPTVVTRSRAEGDVLGFFLVDGEVWVRLARPEARPLGQVRSDSGGAPVVMAPMTRANDAKPEVKEGKVVEIAPGKAIVSLGKNHGVDVSDTMALFARVPALMGPGGGVMRVETLAVGIVTVVADDRAEVALGSNEEVPVGTLAAKTRESPTASLLRPPRTGGHFEVGLGLRPLIPIGTGGFGVVAALSVGYRFQLPIALSFEAIPLAFGFGAEDGVSAIHGGFIGGLSFDGEFFEVGLGLGYVQSADTDVSGFAFAQTARLGPRDGLNVLVKNSFVYRESKFGYGGTSASFFIPLTSRLQLVLQGEGAPDHGFGDLGLRIRAFGNGRHGSWYFTPLVGGGALSGRDDVECAKTDTATGTAFVSTCKKRSTYAGPTVGLTVEWRP